VSWFTGNIYGDMAYNSKIYEKKISELGDIYKRVQEKVYEYRMATHFIPNSKIFSYVATQEQDIGLLEKYSWLSLVSYLSFCDKSIRP